MSILTPVGWEQSGNPLHRKGPLNLILKLVSPLTLQLSNRGREDGVFLTVCFLYLQSMLAAQHFGLLQATRCQPDKLSAPVFCNSWIGSPNKHCPSTKHRPSTQLLSHPVQDGIYSEFGRRLQKHIPVT